MTPRPETMEVITVQGPIPPAQMGITYTHEHLVIDAMDHYPSYEFVIDDEDITPRALEKAVEAYTKSGNEAEAKKTLNLLQSRYPDHHVLAGLAEAGVYSYGVRRIVGSRYAHSTAAFTN